MDTITIGTNNAFVVQKKLTPCKKPRNSGGSPKGVNEPPTFATKKIKNTMTCVLFSLQALALINGLISSIADPVVPIHEAKIVPIVSIAVFNFGVPTNFPSTHIPPETTNKDNRIVIKGIYSNNIVCTTDSKTIFILLTLK